MDKIYLKDVEIFANHGVFKEEKVLGQKFIFDIELKLDLIKAGRFGNLEDSVHYGELCHGIEKVVCEESTDLIETVGERVATYILDTYPLVLEVKVKVKKPWAPINRHLKYAAIEINRGWHTSYLSIGSNIGDKILNLQKAIELINKIEGTTVTKRSDFIKTEPWGLKEQEEFLNGALEVKTRLEPRDFMRELLKIEKDMKRERIIKWGPRIIDLDIIFFDDLVLSFDDLVLPHPRMEEREFVLKPLSQIAPYKLHPVLNKRVFRLLEEIE